MAGVGGLLALWPTSSFAAPIGGVNEARVPSAVTQVRYQCWWADGNRHCADITGGDYDYDRRYRDLLVSVQLKPLASAGLLGRAKTIARLVRRPKRRG